MMKLFMLFSFFVDGFAYAGEALVGKAIGAQQSAVSNQPSAVSHQLSTTIRALFAWGIGVGLIFTLIYALCPDAIFRSMTTDQDVVAALHRYIGWLIAMPMVSMLAFMWDGIYAGATQGKAIRNAMLWAAFAFAATYYILSSSHPFTLSLVHALYAAYFAHLLARVIYLTCKYPSLRTSADL